jgi:hypothetical protein
MLNLTLSISSSSVLPTFLAFSCPLLKSLTPKESPKALHTTIMHLQLQGTTESLFEQPLSLRYHIQKSEKSLELLKVKLSMQEIIKLRLRSLKLDGSLYLVHHKETNLNCGS